MVGRRNVCGIGWSQVSRRNENGAMAANGAISHNGRKVLGLILTGGPVTSLGDGQLPLGTMIGGAALAGVGHRKPMMHNFNQSFGPH